MSKLKSEIQTIQEILW